MTVVSAKSAYVGAKSAYVARTLVPTALCAYRQGHSPALHLV